MSRHRAVIEEQNKSSSDEEDDVFSALARRGKGKKGTKPPPLKKIKIKSCTSTDENSGAATAPDAAKKPIASPLPLPQTSSTKRHHGGTKNRQDLDSLLEELKAESSIRHTTTVPNGSFVRSGEESTTTNVFVGNLAPTTTQEQLTQLFGQFGDLHSTKIMWPREEGAVLKLNAFVCFVHREDAENALEACDNMDPFGTGHVLKLSWGKHILQPQEHNQQYDSDKEEELAWRRPGDQRRRDELSQEEQDQFDLMFRTHLSASRDAICKAMAFCFEKSTAAQHICSLWKPILLNVSPTDSVETLVARLYLLSDVLYNSQQPGIRNAFLYRNFVEEVSRDVFQIMGEYSRKVFGRMKSVKLNLAVNAILGAWALWGVYDPAFLNEVRCAYEGTEPGKSNSSDKGTLQSVQQVEPSVDLSVDGGDYERFPENTRSDVSSNETDDIDGEPLEYGDLEGVSLDSDFLDRIETVDGEALDSEGDEIGNEDVV